MVLIPVFKNLNSKPWRNTPGNMKFEDTNRIHTYSEKRIGNG